MFLQNLEKWRLQQHFKQVNTILRHRDVSHLPETIKHERDNQLNCLASYAERGIFPHNYEKLPYSPCFIDKEGRECAVAHLLIESGQEEFANRVVNLANYEYVPDMDFPELESWAAHSGLSKDELALIQPGYPFAFEGLIANLSYISWIIGLFTTFVNLLYLRRKICDKFFSVFSVFVAILLAGVSLYLGFFWLINRSYRTSIDVPQYIINRALEFSHGFFLGMIVSVILSLITASLAINTLRNIHHDNKQKKRHSRFRLFKIRNHNRKMRSKNRL